MKKSAKLTVRGLVQGVGYRYFCSDAARSLNVNGYVTNLPNGDVELEIECDEVVFENFISQLKRGPFSARVTEIKIEEMEFEGKFDMFKII